MIPKVLKNFNLFIDGTAYAGLVEELTLPKLSLKMDEYRNGGMDVPIDLEMGMDKLECDFTLSEYDTDSIDMFGLRDGAQVSLKFLGGLDGEGDASNVVSVEVLVNGALKDLDMGSWKAGEKAPLKSTVCVRYYKLSIGGVEKVEIIPDSLVRRINGVNQLNAMQTAIGMAATA